MINITHRNLAKNSLNETQYFQLNGLQVQNPQAWNTRCSYPKLIASLVLYYQDDFFFLKCHNKELLSDILLCEKTKDSVNILETL